MYKEQWAELEEESDPRVQQHKWETANDDFQAQINKCESSALNIQSQINDLKTTLNIKKRDREKENDRKAELLDEIDAVKGKIDHYNRLVGNEDAIRDEVEDRVQEEIDDLQRNVHEVDRKILERKEEIDMADSDIDALSAAKVKGTEDLYEYQEKYRDVLKSLESNRKKFIESQVKKDFLIYREQNMRIVKFTKLIAQLRDKDIKHILEDKQLLKEQCQKYETLVRNFFVVLIFLA